jgi:serine/threonine-protein kinase HipA
MSPRALDAWLYGTLVAHVERDREDGVRLTFSPEALTRWGHGSAVMSGLLPLSERSPSTTAVAAWLRGLMPEGRARGHLAERAGVPPDDGVGFLAVYGRDTAGAVTLVPRGAAPDRPKVPLRTLDDAEIGELLDEATAQGVADQPTSIAGLEAKAVLTSTVDGFAHPTPDRPSTHILKVARPADSRSADLTDTEAAALALARACGLGDVEAQHREFAGRRTLVVRRYDRVVLDDRTERVHQEDMAQLLGLDTSDPERKFQYGKRLPALREIALRLDRLGVPLRDLLALTTFNLAIGNADAHAKNVSVLHLEDGTHRLAPVYDVAMHMHHEHAEQRFAMDVDGGRGMHELSSAHLTAEAASWGVPPRLASRVVRETLEQLDRTLAAVARTDHPGVGESAWATVESRVRRLLGGDPAR